jgi:voltage-gated potassium channel
MQAAAPAARLGQPRSDADAAFVERFDSRMRVPIIVSPLLPLVVVPQSGGWFPALIGVLTRRLFGRLGRVAAVALGVTFVGSVVAYHAEHPVNSEFATFGDALWWGFVTLTTVGYGDVVPKTPTGRWAGVAIMVTGIAVLGLLSGTLASFFRLDPGDTASNTVNAVEDQGADAADEPKPLENVMATLADEVASLRRQIEVLTERIQSGHQADQPP